MQKVLKNKTILSSKSYDKDLVVNEHEIITLESGRQYVFDSITIHKYGVLTVPKYANNMRNDSDYFGKGGFMNIEVNKLIIHEYGCIDVSGKGYKGGKHRKNGQGLGQGMYTQCIYYIIYCSIHEIILFHYSRLLSSWIIL